MYYIEILDDDRLCLSVRNFRNGSVRTISKSLLEEFIQYEKQHPDETATQFRNALSGQTNIDKYEYGYDSTLLKLAKMNKSVQGHTVTMPALSLYKQELPSFWENERYKWQAVQRFQKEWDLDADDFFEMLKSATSKHENLLSSNNYFPQLMILKFAEVYPERVRLMFRNLYDEQQDLAQRIISFMIEAESIKATKPEWNNHYQDLRAISVYL